MRRQVREQMRSNSKKIAESPDSRVMSLAEAVRKKPGMYFGRTGPEGIPRVVVSLLEAIFRARGGRDRGPIEFSVKEGPSGQEFSLKFHNFRSRAFPSGKPETWFRRSWAKGGWELYAVPAATRRCRLEISDGSRVGIHQWINGVPSSTSVRSKQSPPFLKFMFQLEPAIFQKATEEQLYKTSGILRTLSALRAGTPIVFKADLLEGEIRFYYKAGLKSLLLESDYQRWPLHAGCLSFRANEANMSVEGHLRFLHAGSVDIINFVNYRPTQGGTHLEGLGMALLELFGNEARGCRDASLVTNPDCGSSIYLPHACLGALHVQMLDPKYYGPTKDVLLSEEAKDFVYRTAMAQLPVQWDRFQKHR